MALRRVVFLEDESSARPEFGEAASQVKRLLSERSIAVGNDPGDGVIAAPGAVGNFSELFRHLDDNDLPCGLLNTSNYYTDLLKTTDDGLVDRFVRETQRGRLIVASDPRALVQAMAEYLPPETRRQAGASD